ncbi:hypothetical protein OC834_003333 [Tilletia horrida]|nr:hypothetical protein OC834_003333 [Tilletia horrida]
MDASWERVVPRLGRVPSYGEFAVSIFMDAMRDALLTILVDVAQDRFLQLVKDWPIFSLLASASSSSLSSSSSSCLHPAFDFLQNAFGPTHTVPVVFPPVEGCSKRKEMRLTDAIKLMRAHKLSGQEGAVYIKDYHLFRQERQLARQRQSMAIPSDSENSVSVAEPQSPEQLYEPPFPFRDDWMNNIREAKDGDEPDDFAFCYAGSAGSFTNLHRDVYTSYSWSTNIIGRKRWRLFPPSCISMLRRFPNVRTSELASSCDEMDERYSQGKLGPVSEGKDGWPLWGDVRSQACELLQEAGETIFVPSNWYHEVLNLTDCISINHNWCNSYNLESMYDSMVEEVEDVEASLEDVRSMLQERDISTSVSSSPDWQREWVGIVQQVARQDAGWAWEGFWDMVEHNLRSPPTEVSTPLAYAGTELLNRKEC